MPGEKNEPYGLEALRPESVQLYGGLYVAADDLATDRANAQALFEQLLLLLDSTWDDDNGGIAETVGTTGIATIAQGGDGSPLHPATTGRPEATTDIVITIARSWEDSAEARKTLPVVLYKGDLVPMAVGSADGIVQIGDGKTAGELVIIVKNANLSFGPADPVEADWMVHLHGPVRCVKSINGPSADMPWTETEHKTLGTSGTSVKRRVQDGESYELSFTAYEHKGRVYVQYGAGGTGGEVLNWPGEEIERILYGTEGWTKGGENKVTYQPSGYHLGLMVVHFNPEFLAGTVKLHGAAGDAGQVVAVVHFLYGCELSRIDAPGNVEAGSDQFVERSYTVKPADYRKKVILTVTP